ncbi:MAG: VanZ family protein [Candidatus Shapirobacteria bacterium]
MKTKAKRALRFLGPILWMAFIFYLSSRQRIAVSSNYWLSFFIFKTLHIIEYGILFFFWYSALYDRKDRLRLAIIFSFLYAVFDELHQKFVPTREGKVRDVFIDLLGIIIFWQVFLNRLEKTIIKIPILKNILPS